MLIGDEGDGVQMAVGLGATVQLEHLRPQHAARAVSNTLPAQIERLEHGPGRGVEFRQGAEILCAFPDVSIARASSTG